MRYSKRKTKKDVFATGMKQRKKTHLLLFTISIICTTVYLAWRTFFTIPYRYGAVALVLGVLLLAAEIMAAAEAMIQFRQINKRMVPELPEIPEEWYPDVDIFVATHNEPADLLYKTLNACNYLQYPEKRKVHVYLCDDNDRPEMAQLASKLGVGYFGLSDNKHAKAGNLNNALRKTDSPLVATFDSDMIPTSDFLLKTVPYFFLPRMKKNTNTGKWEIRDDAEIDSNYKIGFIQSPQSFYNPDLFQFNLFSETRIPNEQDYFFREVNVGRNADNGVIYAGSNTLLSRKALEEVGYIATTSITEDFLTGLRIQKKGYTTYAIPEEMAHGLAPNTIQSLFKQRERWGRGCIQALRQERLITTRDLRVWTKLSYFATWSYWWAFARRFIYIISPIVSVLFNLPVMDVYTWQILAFWLPHYFFSNMALKSFSNGVRNRHWSNVYDTILFPYLIGPIFFEFLGIKKRKFVVTDKNRSKNNKHGLSLLFAMPHIEMLLASLLALIVCIRVSIVTNSFYSPFIFFWLVMNMKNLVFAIFFMYGRENFRTADRYYVEEQAEIAYNGKEYTAKTSDISETGLALQFYRPIYLPPEIPINIRLTNKKYKAEITAKVFHVIRAGERWKYSFKIEGIDDANMSAYMQIVYDRRHTMPRNLDATLSIFDDFNINFTKRSSSGQLQQAFFTERGISGRALPRIALDLPFVLGGTFGVIVDFNYRYVLLTFDTPAERLGVDELYRFFVYPGTFLFLESIPGGVNSGKGELFRIVDAEKFAEAPDIDEIIEAWLRLEKMEQKPVASGMVVPRTAVEQYNPEMAARHV